MQRIRRRRRKDAEILDPEASGTTATTPPADEDVSTFFQIEAEAEKLQKHMRRECPVPKPSGRLGELLGFTDGNDGSEQRGRD